MAQTNKRRQTKPLTALLKSFPRGHLIALAGLGSCLLLALVIPSAPSSTTIPAPQAHYEARPLLPGLDSPIDEELLPLRAPTEEISSPLRQAAQIIEPKERDAKEFTVQSGDSLSLIFRRAGLGDKDIYELFSSAPQAKDLRKIRPGQKLAFSLDGERLQKLTYTMNALDSLTFTRGAKGFASEDTSLKPDIKHAFSVGTIDSSLYMAGKRAGMSAGLTMELANIFGWDIDFALDIKKGDTFKVMYEEQVLDGKTIGYGKVLAAEFTNGGKTFRAVRYIDKDGTAGYYTPDGRGMQKAFLRSPIEFARISSHFNLSRKHPVLHIIRAHKGTDYAAARGTPIRVTGNGKIEFAGVKGGYGNCIIVNHGSGLKTLYGHMNGFAKGMRAGARVSQGDVIGYVGSTGLASGPHLHYEFHMNGQVRNPVTVPLPKSMGIDKNQLAHFNANTRPLIAKLNEMSDKHTQVAMSKGGTSNN